MLYERFERENIVLFLAAILLSAVIFTNVLSPVSSSGSMVSGVQETNLGGLRIMDGRSPKTVFYNDGAIEYFPNNFVGLFINGSIIQNANIIIENDRALGPLRLIAEKMGAGVNWDVDTQTITIIDKDIKIELVIGEKTAKLNDISIPIDTAPQLINDYTYVPIRFIAESLNYKVDWFDGKAAQKWDGPSMPQPHYVLRMQQVMVSRYPAGAKAMGHSEAVQRLKSQLITAYVNNYNDTYKPLLTKPDILNEKDSIRYAISTLAVTSENDRFIIIPMQRDYMIDKYTGSVYVFYDGEVQTIDKFEPNAPLALSF